MTIQIKNLRLRTIIGIYDWERNTPQEVVINLSFEYDGSQAAGSDRIEDTVDYKTLRDLIADTVEQSKFFLLEKLAQTILNLIMAHPKITAATVEVDKPQALQFADSVSVIQSSTKK